MPNPYDCYYGLGSYHYWRTAKSKFVRTIAFWMKDKQQVKIQRPETTYAFFLKQRFATGLQVTKDPGVWYVYTGCGLMILGLFVVFFLSHRRMWVYLREEDAKTKIILAGTANKNKIGLEKDVDNLASLLKENDKLNLIED